MVQAELLWFGEFHRHAEDQVRQGQATVLLHAPELSKDVTQRPFCVACQISRENTARPPTAFPSPAPDVVTCFRPAFSFLGLDQSSVIVLPARAPPISL